MRRIAQLFPCAALPETAPYRIGPDRRRGSTDGHTGQPTLRSQGPTAAAFLLHPRQRVVLVATQLAPARYHYVIISDVFRYVGRIYGSRNIASKGRGTGSMDSGKNDRDVVRYGADIDGTSRLSNGFSFSPFFCKYFYQIAP